MGMFDTLFVKKELPLTEELKALNIKWNEIDFQTKDLDNLLDTYEITEDGTLRHLWQERKWKDNEDAFLKGYFEVIKEEWRIIEFHGTINFYTGYSDDIKYHWDYINDDPEQVTWDDIELIQGYDWWIEYEASFTKGQLDGFKLIKADKTPIRERIKNNKIWAEKRAKENKKIHRQIISGLRKFKCYRKFICMIVRLENRVHNILTKILYKL